MKAAHLGDESWASRMQSALAHALIYLLAVAAFARILSWFGLLGWVDLLTATALVMCWAVSGFHRRRNQLCIRCMDDVPADAPARAERQRFPLWFVHFNSTVQGLTATAMLVLGARLPHAITGDATLRLLQIPGDLWMFAIIYSEWLHHRLRPWCPYCRPWDEGGDEEPAPDPTSLGTKVRG